MTRGTSPRTKKVLVGADGPRSHVARASGLGENSKFLHGIDRQYVDAPIDQPNLLYYFIDRRLMPVYIGWRSGCAPGNQTPHTKREAQDVTNLPHGRAR